MKVFSLLWLLVTGLAISMAQDQCQNMWEVTDFLDPNLKICDGIFLKCFTLFYYFYFISSRFDLFEF